MLTEIPATKAREVFADLLDNVGFREKRYFITRRKKPIVAIISAADYEVFELLMRRFEDYIDARDAEAAIKEAEREGMISFEELASELGI